ncbi:ion transporter [Methylicorpusculum oleiharenae]|uniref:ion transporter n=1 Tax=Methylicorpusculum oleiharenae TaxID=1338687 RepID=UPI0013587619|nr:ion transporter [Methylicorpusculum oleiharenae]MCD2452673.1 ion transporter [Methylicorpusculum oleiharenae]
MTERKPVKLQNHSEDSPASAWRSALNQIIFGAETRAGKAFDIVLIIMILLSILTVMFDSIEAMRNQYGQQLYGAEWFFTLLFSFEYLLRLICVRKPWLYARSFFGFIDLLSILPTFLGLLIPGAEYMLTLRILRMLRIFRILKLSEYIREANILMVALNNSFRKITVFLFTVLMLVVVFGALMYMIESSESGFTSIPTSIYWAIVTITTVGYGDISPQTALGQFVASMIMIMGYGIIAVPTGIYSAELMKSQKSKPIDNESCPGCGATGHDFDADYCKYCGHFLGEDD